MRLFFFSYSRAIYVSVYCRVKELLSSKGNGQCFISDLLLHIAGMCVGGGGGKGGFSYRPRAIC